MHITLQVPFEDSVMTAMLGNVWPLGGNTKEKLPQSLNDLRLIAITPLPSLICEDFVFDWAYSDIKTSIDSQQFGNMKCSSTTHLERGLKTRNPSRRAAPMSP